LVVAGRQQSISAAEATAETSVSRHQVCRGKVRGEVKKQLPGGNCFPAETVTLITAVT
jgi:hypothetical protein